MPLPGKVLQKSICRNQICLLYSRDLDNTPCWKSDICNIIIKQSRSLMISPLKNNGELIGMLEIVA